jgi:hypothetical protein
MIARLDLANETPERRVLATGNVSGALTVGGCVDPSADAEVARFVGQDGPACRAEIVISQGQIRRFELFEPHPVGSCDYLAHGLPWEVHCHGLGELNFTDLDQFDLLEVERLSALEQVVTIPTIYLPKPNFEPFLRLMHRFASMRDDGLLPHVAGMAIEGPMLGSFGGTPEQGVWPPTASEWEQLAACGPLGLAYMVVSPDAWLPGSHLVDALSSQHPPLAWVVRTLVEHGVRPALGHFTRTDPTASAAAIEEVLAVAAVAGGDVGGSGGRGTVITDHLFNDMPVNVPYAWRRPADQQRRAEELERLELASWSLDDLDRTLGPVPATLIRAAHDGAIVVCLNFDDEHVDLAVAHRAAELIGIGGLMAMTDRTDAATLGGQRLHHEPGTNLWYQEQGIVAAGSTPIDCQLRNMERVAMPEHRAWDVASFTPTRVFDRRARTDAASYSWVRPGIGRMAVVPAAELV